MEIIMVDWKIEKEGWKLFRNYDYRFQLQEVTDRGYSQITKRILLNTNDINEIIRKIGELAISHPKCLEIVTNQTLKYYQEKQDKENIL